MRRRLGFSLIAAVLVAAPVGAQTKAKAENVPDIPRTSVPNFFKLPAGPVFRRRHRHRHQLEGTRLRLHAAAATRACSSSIRTATSSARSAQGIYGFEFAHAVRVDAQDNIWAVDEGTNMVIKFNPEGRVVMVLGRRPGAGMTGAFDSTLPPAPPEKYRFGRPTDVAWDAQGNIFVSDGYVNSRVVKYDKNGRFIKSVGGSARIGTEPVQHAALDRDRRPGQRLRRRSRQRAHAGVRQRPDAAGDLRQRRQPVGGLRLARARTSTSSCSNSNPDAQSGRRRGPSPARSTRWSSTARSSASSARPARRWASSARSTRSTAATRTSSSSPRSRRGARRRSC